MDAISLCKRKTKQEMKIQREADQHTKKWNMKNKAQGNNCAVNQKQKIMTTKRAKTHCMQGYFKKQKQNFR